MTKNKIRNQFFKHFFFLSSYRLTKILKNHRLVCFWNIAYLFAKMENEKLLLLSTSQDSQFFKTLTIPGNWLPHLYKTFLGRQQKSLVGFKRTNWHPFDNGTSQCAVATFLFFFPSLPRLPELCNAQWGLKFYQPALRFVNQKDQVILAPGRGNFGWFFFFFDFFKGSPTLK